MASVLGCAIDRVDMEAALDRCDEFIESGRFAQHMAVNAAKLVTMQDDAAMREITARCDLVTADGQAVVWASRGSSGSGRNRAACCGATRRATPASPSSWPRSGSGGAGALRASRAELGPLAIAPPVEEAALPRGGLVALGLGPHEGLVHDRR